MILENKEGIKEFDIPKDWYLNRELGLTAMIRVKNEEEFIVPCLLSIKNLFDKICIFMNNSTDNTEMLIRELNLPHVEIYHYPFEIKWVAGVNHSGSEPDSVYSLEYFYNWCLSMTKTTHVCKWDGDMVLLDSVNSPTLKKEAMTSSVLVVGGVDVCYGLTHHPAEKLCDAEPRFFEVNENTYYIKATDYEILQFRPDDKSGIVTGVIYLHLKCAKEENKDKYEKHISLQYKLPEVLKHKELKKRD